MPERDFLVFWIFLLYFLQFSCPGRVWAEFGTIISFFPFSAYLISFSLKIMPERGFLIFWIILLFFFRNFLTRVEYVPNLRLNFFSLFLGLVQSVFIRNNAGINCFNFLNFFAIFFLEFSSSCWEGTEFGTKFFFSLSRPISSRFG